MKALPGDSMVTEQMQKVLAKTRAKLQAQFEAKAKEKDSQSVFSISTGQFCAFEIRRVTYENQKNAHVDFLFSLYIY
jgi:hypothetical protein